MIPNKSSDQNCSQQDAVNEPYDDRGRKTAAPYYRIECQVAPISRKHGEDRRDRSRDKERTDRQIERDIEQLLPGHRFDLIGGHCCDKYHHQGAYNARQEGVNEYRTRGKIVERLDQQKQKRGGGS